MTIQLLRHDQTKKTPRRVRRGVGREELFPLFEEFNFAELQASAGSHLNKFEAIVAERTCALWLETILLFVLVTKSASAFLLRR